MAESLVAEPTVWYRDPDWVQLILVGIAVLVAVARQFWSWFAGWRIYGRDSILVDKDPDDKGRAPERMMLCSHHVLGSGPPPEETGYRGVTYRLTDLVVKPMALGTRHWTYEETDGVRLGWPRWVGTCLLLSLTKRFTESEIASCGKCLEDRFDRAE